MVEIIIIKNNIMKTTLKIVSIIEIVIGSLAIFGSFDPLDGYALLGGALFVACGWIALVYIGENK